MSTRLIAADLPKLTQVSPVVQHFRGIIRRLLSRFASKAGADDRPLAVEDRLIIGPKKSLVLVRCHGRRFLIASAGDAVGPILEVEIPKANRRASKPVSRERKA